MEDSLNKLYYKHLELHDRITKENPKFPRDKGQRINALCQAIIHEAVELQNECNWKWWKNKHIYDLPKMREELIDILHFVIAVSIELHMTPEQIVEEFLKKDEINHKRQDDGY